MLDKPGASETAPFLRRVRHWDRDDQRELIFLTNNLELEAEVVASVYKERWQINAVGTQIGQH